MATMSNDQLLYLDSIASDLREQREDRFWVLSTGERLYCALAASRADLLKEMGYSIAGALYRLGRDDTLALVSRWHGH